jgi:hypothetical protein
LDKLRASADGVSTRRRFSSSFRLRICLKQETVRTGSSITPSANDTAHLDSLLAPMLVEAAAIMATRAGPSTWLDLFY